MSQAGLRLHGQVAEMQRQFDESFAQARAHEVAARERMLAIMLEGESFAMRLSQIMGLTLAPGKIQPAPSRFPEFLGLAGIRGLLLPVFGLAALLGFSTSSDKPRWLLLCGGRQSPIALAFQDLEFQFEAAPEEIYAADQARRYINQTVSHATKLRGIIDLVSLQEYVKGRGQSGDAAGG